ncbi:MAG: hypothetical protein CME71_03705 [Halobacteriovorax sp.]|nr:hypothetical protein [Halobacteriovorax sp.]
MIFVNLLQQKPLPSPTQKEQPVAVATAAPQVAKKVVAKPAPVKKPAVISVNAKFEFYATRENPSLPEGSYQMQGRFDERDGRLQLGGLAWIKRPANYDMVPLSGFIDSSKEKFEGRIEFQGCKVFTLKRLTDTKGSPIAGRWRGQYDCTQGITGLTLTIE